jgi:uncharacterized radical SAM superfamily Fe-S cluster-containing enzyme
VWNDLELYRWIFQFKRKGTAAKNLATSIDKGCPNDCGLCPEHDQHTCLAILDVTQRCNLRCPVCLSSSPKTGHDPKIDQIENMLRALLKYEGGPTAIQISGGEPTVRKDLTEIVQLATDLGFEFIEVDTNGIELAKDPKLAKELADAGLDGIYLQFDGLSDEIYATIRGQNLLATKKKAVKNSRKAGLSVVLAATIIKGVNDHQLWQIIRYAIKEKALGVNFQAFAALGRFPLEFQDPINKITTLDILRNIESQSGGKLTTKDFLPVPCPDVRCAALTYLVIGKEKITPISRLVNTSDLMSYYAKLANFDEVLEGVKKILNDMYSCSAAFGKRLEENSVSSFSTLGLESLEGQYFSIGCHSLQDAWNMNIDRVKRCCIHELTIDGKLVPFCLYKIKAS